MSIIDTSYGSFSVEFEGRKFGYFNSKIGAEAYLEVLKNERSEYEREIEAVPEVHGMLQSDSDKGSD